MSRASPWGAAGVTAAVLGILWVRWSRHPLEAYGDSAAHLIEHLARFRLLARLEAGLDGGPLAWLVALDGLYPPGLHLVEAAFGAVVGHAPERVVLLGVGWLLLLCSSVAEAARRLGPPGSAPLVFAGVALIPAVQGAALRSYYDLPMTALLWAAVAALAGPGRGRAVAGAALLLAASLIKWTALPFGLAMMFGLAVALDGAGRRRVGGAVVLWAAGVTALLLAGMSSLSTMGGATFQPPPGVAASTWAEALPPPLSGWLGAAAAQVAVTDGARLAFYPARLAASVLSPVGAMVAGVGGAAWLRRGAPAGAVVVATALGQLAFLLLLVPPLDDRFLLTLAPALALAAGVGLVGRPRVSAVAAVALVVVSADAHLRPPLDPTPAVGPGARSAALEGRDWVARGGVASSIDRRGWSRTTDLVAHRGALEARLWGRLRGCGGGGVDGPDAVLLAAGDLNRWTLRRLRDARAGHAPAVRWLGEPSADRRARRLWVQPEPAGALGGSPTPPRGWRQLDVVDDPDGGPGVAIWAPPASPPCG